MKSLVLAAAIAALATPAFAADAVTTNGFITSMNNQIQARVDQFQATHPSNTAVNHLIDNTQTAIGGATSQIKALNPLPNAISPIQPFTIPPL